MLAIVHAHGDETAGVVIVQTVIMYLEFSRVAKVSHL